jgi:segregation and condensation protein A
VVTFIALLELARLKKLKVFQNEAFGTIYLTLTEEIDSLDPKLMTGFQYQARTSINEAATV